MNQYLVLLRGINVGGKNIIKMVDLKASFEEMGFSNVVTYIQSGNVLVQSDDKDKPALMTKIEKGLSKRFNFAAKVVVSSQKELTAIVKSAPEGFGKDDEKFRYDVIFLKEPLTPKEAMESVKVREGVDAAHAGKRASQSYLTKIIGMPVYQNMTIRNWNTTTKLLALMEGQNG
jgi:uncharacterized protein (DUF1697 family)